jgi:hypothetical protein
VRYFEIKRVDVERIDIERSEGVVRDSWMAAAPWEVEAERRREVLVADLGAAARRGVSRRGGLRLAIFVGRRVASSLRGSSLWHTRSARNVHSDSPS